jgi:hypothetical protein
MIGLTRCAPGRSRRLWPNSTSRASSTSTISLSNSSRRAARRGDYDVDIGYADGREACADAKCRLEGTEVRADTIKNSLDKARRNNLPPDNPGIIFLKVPQTWLEQDDVREGIYTVVEGFLRNTERVVPVVVYATAAMELADQNMMLLGGQARGVGMAKLGRNRRWFGGVRTLVLGSVRELRPSIRARGSMC